MGFELEAFCGREPTLSEAKGNAGDRSRNPDPECEATRRQKGRTLAVNLAERVGFELEALCGREPSVSGGGRPQPKS